LKKGAAATSLPFFMKIKFRKNWQSGTHFGAFYKNTEAELPSIIAKAAVRAGFAVEVKQPAEWSAPNLGSFGWNELRALAREQTGKTPKNKAEALALLSNKSLGAAPENKSALAG
jgi:hypothetical protein